MENPIWTLLPPKPGFLNYFEYTYGIDAPKHLKTLVEKGYTVIETAFDSLDHSECYNEKEYFEKQGNYRTI